MEEKIKNTTFEQIKNQLHILFTQGVGALGKNIMETDFEENNLILIKNSQAIESGEEKYISKIRELRNNSKNL